VLARRKEYKLIKNSIKTCAQNLVAKEMKFFWLIPLKLAGSSIPRTEQDLERLRRTGIKAIVILVEEHELLVPIEVYREIGFEILLIPIRDMTAPTLYTLEKIVKWIKQKIDEDKPVLVHCYGGLGRTGTILAAYLVYEGWDPIKAIDYVRSIQPGAIQTTAQYATVIEFAEYMSMINR